MIVYVYSCFRSSFAASTISNAATEPKMKDLSKYVAAVIPDKWMQVADQLELSRSKIRAIRKDEDDCYERFMAVFDQWKQSCCQPYTWESLITALKSVDETGLAYKLKHDFCS